MNAKKNPKRPRWQPAVDIPGVNPKDYYVADGTVQEEPAGSRMRSGQGGLKGMNPQLAGHGKQGHNHTSGFNYPDEDKEFGD